jgi:hypothetical protein
LEKSAEKLTIASGTGQAGPFGLSHGLDIEVMPAPESPVIDKDGTGL